MSDFKREERYIVVKIRDISITQLRLLRGKLEGYNIPTQECVVVEPDWPNYEDTWTAIERVYDGVYKSPYEVIRDKQNEIDKLKGQNAILRDKLGEPVDFTAVIYDLSDVEERDSKIRQELIRQGWTPPKESDHE